MDMLIFLDIAIMVFLYIFIIFLLAIWLRDNSIMDIAWGPLFFLIAFVAIWFSGDFHYVKIILMVFIFLWGFRLGLHIFFRHKGEDYRYQAWRKAWGKYVVVRSFFQIFLLQGVLGYIIALPIIFFLSFPHATHFSFLMIVGGLIFLLGFFYETVADFQLTHFIKHKNPGEIYMQGLWKYSRHPNYFGEICVWWGIFIFTFSSHHFYTIVSPILMTFLLLRISGVPLLEEKYKDNISYQAYKKSTNAIFPTWW